MSLKILILPGSLSARRAWIEIPAGCWRDARRASLSARRAWIEIRNAETLNVLVCVALRKESVDRNFDAVQIVIVVVVALRKESVDRNPPMCTIRQMLLTSLSARRAWIEILILARQVCLVCRSLSARRAWIEI